MHTSLAKQEDAVEAHQFVYPQYQTEPTVVMCNMVVHMHAQDSGRIC